ncbi:hypothetical protein LTR16_002870 [Cryomyces antarcticus]|uniref:DRBM domain-containing protein n=1 Tax=Cryomyces antarcticus TaxID=329879 RepID=A0ABR0LP92_9PEZI|nr:hypothetical protein LTR16_002870 [Cryomyces antarcticus]
MANNNPQPFISSAPVYYQANNTAPPPSSSFQHPTSQPLPTYHGLPPSSTHGLPPPPYPQTQPSYASQGIHNIFSMAEWERQQRIIDHVNASTPHAFPLSSNSHTPSLKRKAKNSHNALPPMPAVPGPSSTGHVARFHEMCQERGITPVFTFSEPFLARFAVSVAFGGTILAHPGPFGSKKDAKEAVCQRAYATLDSMPKPAASKGGKKHSATDSSGQPSQEENHIGLLLEWSTRARSAPPQFTEHILSAGFACECAIAPRSHTPFGSATVTHSTKKAARKAAAREAVEWLREKGEIPRPGEGPPNKRLKKNNSSAAAAVPAAAPPPVVTNYTQQVNEMCALLGFGAPDYRIYPSVPSAITSPTPSNNSPLTTNISTLFSGAAYFPQDPDLAGPIGAVRAIYGRRAAREECARLVLEALGAVKKAREARMGLVGLGSGLPN